MADPLFKRSKRWRNFSRRIKQQRGYKCQRCGIHECAMLQEWLHLHHIIKRTESPNLIYIPENIRLLCQRCHEIEELEGEMAYIQAHPELTGVEQCL